MSSKLVRAALLACALVLSALVWNLPPALASCANGSTQWVIMGGVCCATTQKWKGQSCIFGVWTDNGAVKCQGPCAI